ncbi:MAG: TRAP transporter substrate-binding protein DctP, partial [Fidelibacterota bacterium]
MKRWILWIFILSAWVYPKKIIIKLATLAPEGTELYGQLVDMGQRWKEASDGQVILRIYPNGVVGDERDMIRKMRI